MCSLTSGRLDRFLEKIAHKVLTESHHKMNTLLKSVDFVDSSGRLTRWTFDWVDTQL